MCASVFQLPFGLAVSSDTFYISDWTKNAILSVSISGHITTTLMSDVTTPMALFFTLVTKSISESRSDSGSLMEIIVEI